MSIDAFDELFDAAAPQAAPTTGYAVIPEGRAEVEIVAASIGDVAWKVTEANPRGTCLKLRLSAGRGYAFVFADLPRDRKPLFKALAAALGIGPDADGKVALPPPHELVGRSVAVEIGHYQSKAGATKAGIRKWLPPSTSDATATSQPSTATAAGVGTRRSQSQRITERLPDDEMPF